jgi:two-component system NtrC family sensor kinase
MLEAIHLEKKMLSGSFRWLLNILLAFLIFWNAEIGRLLGIQSLPLAISVVWPATGFSLAAVLLFGVRTWAGIFLGNFFYNFWHLSSQFTMPWTLLVSSTISLGSLTQALFAGLIIRSLSTRTYFTNVRDVFIFLIPAGVLACTIASSVGVTTLYLSGNLPKEQFLYTWLTFWLGDSLGVYIFTPLLVVWSLHTSEIKVQEYKWEAAFMIFFFMLLSFLTFSQSYPLAQLFIPLSLWITYRFRMHGATLAIFMISITAVIFTVLGEGAFVTALKQDPLIVLVSFLEINLATCLIVAAIINERTFAWRVIKKHNLDLQDTIEMHREKLKKMHSEIFIKERLALLGVVTSAVARQTQIPLKELRHYIEKILSSFYKLQDVFQSQSNRLDTDTSNECQKQFESLQEFLRKTTEIESQIDTFVEIMEKELAHSLVVRGEIKVTSVNLHTMLNACLNHIINSDDSVTLIKDFDNTLAMIPALPEDLMHAFSNLLESSLNSINKKKNRLGRTYTPKLELSTKNQEMTVEIIIRDNGWGVEKNRLNRFFHSFMDIQPPEETSDVKLAISHDIIVHIHQGDIIVNSEEEEYFQFKITLPKQLLPLHPG